MAVDRCACTNQKFSELKALAGKGDRALGFDALREKTGCCRRCNLCEPYVREMLRSGKTEFAVVTTPPAAGAGGRVRKARAR